MRTRDAFPTVVEVRRTDRTCTYLWNRQPKGFDRHRAERDDPPRRHRVGHCWPGTDDQHAPVPQGVGRW